MFVQDHGHRGQQRLRNRVGTARQSTIAESALGEEAPPSLTGTGLQTRFYSCQARCRCGPDSAVLFFCPGVRIRSVKGGTSLILLHCHRFHVLYKHGPKEYTVGIMIIGSITSQRLDLLVFQRFYAAMASVSHRMRIKSKSVSFTTSQHFYFLPRLEYGTWAGREVSQTGSGEQDCGRWVPGAGFPVVICMSAGGCFSAS